MIQIQKKRAKNFGDPGHDPQHYIKFTNLRFLFCKIILPVILENLLRIKFCYDRDQFVMLKLKREIRSRKI
jgi:hypothetical protein